MGTKIRDEDFKSPTEINRHPCFTSDRRLRKVDESVTITQVCQDSDNPSLVIIDYILIGVFQFTPFCKITRVDNDTNYEINNVTAPLAIGHFKNPPIPIETNCQTFHGQIVFDFGHVIPNFLSAREIEFTLGMIGQVPRAYGVSFPDQTPTDDYVWMKGVLPNPVNILYSNGNLLVVFEYNGNRDCSCNIQCVTPSGVNQDVLFCPNQKQSIILYQGDLNGDPFSSLVQVRDGLGNTSDFNVQSLIGVNVRPPTISVGTKPRRVEVSISRQSRNGTKLENVEYQIYKYQGSPSNYRLWKDWSFRNWELFVDYDVIPGEAYGYAVKYKGKFQDISLASSWAEIII